MPDLRLPVGLFFIVAGIILLVESFIAHPMRQGMPVDLYWGGLLLLFGLIMTYAGWSAGPEPIPEEDHGVDSPEPSA